MSDKKLKTVEEYNQEIRQARVDTAKTGIACPTCREELFHTYEWDWSKPETKTGVMCQKCGYTGQVEAI